MSSILDRVSSSLHHIHASDAFFLFSRIDSLFLDKATPTDAYRLETFRSAGSISATASQQLRCYFVSRCNFPDTPAQKDANGKTDIKSVSDAAFLEKATQNTLDVYQQVMWNVESRYGPVMEVFEVEGTRERRLVIGFKMGGTTSFFRCVLYFSTISREDVLMFYCSAPCRTSTTFTRSTPPANMSVSCNPIHQACCR